MQAENTTDGFGEIKGKSEVFPARGAFHFRGDCVDTWREVGFEAPAESSKPLPEIPPPSPGGLGPIPERDVKRAFRIKQGEPSRK